MHFFDISTSKSVLNVECFSFSLANVLRAATACTFSTSQLLNVLRSWGVLYILTWKCASRHNGVQLVISHLTTWLRTRRFSKPTFWPLSSPLLSSPLLFSSLLFSSLTRPTSAFHVSILSEVWLLNFLRRYWSLFYHFFRLRNHNRRRTTRTASSRWPSVSSSTASPSPRWMAGRRSDVVSFWWFSWEKPWKTIGKPMKYIYILERGLTYLILM